MIAETLAQRSLSYQEERGKPLPSVNHSSVQVNLIGEFMKRREFRVQSELTLEFAGTTYTPDLSIYHRKPLDFRHDTIRVADPPLTVVEIFSPTQGYQEVMDKVEIYFQNGVGSCWLVSPHLKSVTVLTPDGREKTFDSGVVKDPVTGLAADLAEVFA